MTEKILIVEDDNNINQLLYDLLEEDYVLEQAFSGTEAQRLVHEADYDLMLLDLMLPGLSGEELIVDIREESNIPIIVITAKSDVHVLENVLTIGANDFIAKPFHTVEVRARVETQLKNHSKENTKKQKNELSAGQVSIDLESRMVQINGHSIDLKVKEFELLKCFLNFPDKVFTKANLYESVWQETYFGDDNTISVHISRLRNKLNQYSDKEMIETIWGVGFKFNR